MNTTLIFSDSLEATLGSDFSNKMNYNQHRTKLYVLNQLNSVCINKINKYYNTNYLHFFKNSKKTQFVC